MLSNISCRLFAFRGHFNLVFLFALGFDEVQNSEYKSLLLDQSVMCKSIQ